MFTVIGNGFGLYGYLPAIIEETGDDIVMPTTVMDIILKRGELKKYYSKIVWVDSHDIATQMAEAVVIAVPPEYQPDIVYQILAKSNVKKLIIEKPIATTPSAAVLLTSQLINSNIQFRIGYNMLHTNWFNNIFLSNLHKSCDSVEINWSFMAHHFANKLYNWKRFHSKGGGVVRFFGIHMMALLSDVGYTHSHNSRITGIEKDEPEYWESTYSGSNLPDCKVTVNSNSIMPVFQIVFNKKKNKEIILNISTPFSSEATIDNTDVRVSVIKKLIKSFESDDAEYLGFVTRSNKLWIDSEQGSTWLNSSEQL